MSRLLIAILTGLMLGCGSNDMGPTAQGSIWARQNCQPPSRDGDDGLAKALAKLIHQKLEINQESSAIFLLTFNGVVVPRRERLMDRLHQHGLMWTEDKTVAGPPATEFEIVEEDQCFRLVYRGYGPGYKHYEDVELSWVDGIWEYRLASTGAAH